MAENVLVLWIQRLSGLVGALILAILGGGYWLRGKFSGIHKRVDDLQNSIDGLGSSIATQIQLTGVIIEGLRQNKIMDNAELTKIEQIYMENNMATIRRTIDKERSTENPLTQEELAQLDAHIHKAERGEQFTHSEIQRYNIMTLIGLGALLFGTWIGNQKDIRRIHRVNKKDEQSIELDRELLSNHSLQPTVKGGG